MIFISNVANFTFLPRLPYQHLVKFSVTADEQKFWNGRNLRGRLQVSDRKFCNSWGGCSLPGLLNLPPVPPPLPNP